MLSIDKNTLLPNYLQIFAYSIKSISDDESKPIAGRINLLVEMAMNIPDVEFRILIFALIIDRFIPVLIQELLNLSDPDLRENHEDYLIHLRNLLQLVSNQLHFLN